MKKALYSALTLASFLFVCMFVGCQTVVTDVNAELQAMGVGNDEKGIPVNFNENYVEVAYDANAGKTNEESEEGTLENEVNTETPDDKALDEVPGADSKEDTDEDTDEDGDDEDADSKDGEETEEENSEDADDEDSQDSDDEDTSDPDANASISDENFDAEFYAQTYPDVVAVFGDSPEALLKHYQDYGKAEGRSANAEEYGLLNDTAQDNTTE